MASFAQDSTPFGLALSAEFGGSSQEVPVTWNRQSACRNAVIFSKQLELDGREVCLAGSDVQSDVSADRDAYEPSYRHHRPQSDRSRAPPPRLALPTVVVIREKRDAGSLEIGKAENTYEVAGLQEPRRRVVVELVVRKTRAALTSRCSPSAASRLDPTINISLARTIQLYHRA